MSSGLGYPDWQKIQQWIGSPLDEATGAAIGAGAINLGPYNLASWASIVVALKPTGGKVTITVKQKLNGGPATLELDEVFVVNAGSTLFEAVVLFGDVVSVTLQGDTVGETVDYAVYPSNTTTNAQVITNATINVQHNDALVAAEQTIDFEDAAGFVWTIVDDAPNTRVKITPPSPALVQIADAIVGAGGAASIDFQNIPQTYNHLRAIIQERGANVATVLDNYVRINNDSGANYGEVYNRSVEGAAAMGVFRGDTGAFLWDGAAGGDGAGEASVGELIIPNYARTDFRKQVVAYGGFVGVAGTSSVAQVTANSWQNTAAVNRLTFYKSAGLLAQGSRVTLYGML